MKETSCAIIGSPPLSFPWGYDEDDEGCVALKLLLLSEVFRLYKQGNSRFIVPLDSGIGLYAAEAVNVLRESHADMELICYIPHEEQAVKWTPQLRDRYYAVLAKCTETNLVSTGKTSTCGLDTILDAIDQAGTVLAVCSAEENGDINLSVALRYAEKIGRGIIRIMPQRLI